MAEHDLSDRDRAELVVAVLLGMEIFARVVEGKEHVSVQVNANGERIFWTAAGGTWAWTAVSMQDGSTRSGVGSVARDADVDVIVEMILVSRLS